MVILAKLICAAPLLFGNIPESIQKRAEFVCRRDYSGCVVSIRETGPQEYQVTCKRSKSTSRTAENLNE